jgi:HTH-type transcriptional regulator/antitoxin HipB
MNIEEIGKMIRESRKSLKLSQAEVGKLLSMSRATISGIENGTITEIGVRKLMALCAVLGLELIAAPKLKRPTLQELIKEQHETRRA